MLFGFSISYTSYTVFLAILMASGVSLENARSAVRLSVGRDTTSQQIELTVQMLKSAIKSS